MMASPTPPIRPDPARGSASAPFGLLVAVLFAGAATLALRRVPNHDVAWLVHVAERVTQGAVLYVDVIETNPPLIVWLTQVPVWLATAASWAPMVTLRVSILCSVAVSLWLVWHRLRHAAAGDPNLAAHGTLVALFVLLVLPGYHFGQREHLLLILTLPYVVSTALHWASSPPSPRAAVAIGLMAGAGFALKPHFVLLWIALEAYTGWRLGRQAWRRPEAVVVALALSTYSIAVVVWARPYFQLLATYAQAYLGFSARPLGQLVLHGSLLAGLLLAGAFRVLAPTGARCELARGSLILLLATAAIAVVQGKGFAYHYYPPVSAAYLTAGFLLAAGRRVAAPGPRWAGSTLALLGTVGLTATVIREVRVTMDPTRERIVATMRRLEAVVDREAPGAALLVLSAHPSVAFPLVTSSGASWEFRFSSLWPLAGVHGVRGVGAATRAYDAATAHPVERAVVEALAQDLRDRPPTLLIVDEAPAKSAFRGEPFDFLQFFAGDARLRALFDDYAPVTAVGHFTVYRRRTQVPARR